MMPLQMRPLSVLAQLYRAWAGMRMEEAMLHHVQELRDCC